MAPKLRLRTWSVRRGKGKGYAKAKGIKSKGWVQHCRRGIITLRTGAEQLATCMEQIEQKEYATRTQTQTYTHTLPYPTLPSTWTLGRLPKGPSGLDTHCLLCCTSVLKFPRISTACPLPFPNPATTMGTAMCVCVCVCG